MTCRCVSATKASLNRPRAIPRLVGDDDDRMPGAVEQADGIDAVWKKHQPLEPVGVPAFFEERAITIEKHRGFDRHHESVTTTRWSSRAATAAKTASDGDALHAPVIDGAFAQHAGAAEYLVRRARRDRRAAPSRARRSGRRSATTGTPIAAARCIAPESFDTKAAHRASTPASAPRSVRPDEVDRRGDGRGQRRFYLMARIAIGHGADEHDTAPRSVDQRTASSATRSGGHRLAWP